LKNFFDHVNKAAEPEKPSRKNPTFPNNKDLRAYLVLLC
jgi:hypothetical protein